MLDTNLDTLLSRWLQARALGQNISLDELCGDDAALADELTRRIQAIQQMEALMDRKEHPTAEHGGIPTPSIESPETLASEPTPDTSCARRQICAPRPAR
jgi:hypothetical protein